jgi:alanine dehydrogenase
LNNATLPYVLALAEQGWQKALGADPGFAEGLNIHAGKVSHPAVAEDLDYDYVAPETLLG